MTDQDRIEALERDVRALRLELSVIRKQEGMLRIRDAAALLGISERTFRRRVADGTLPPPRRIRGIPRWGREALAKWAR